MMIHCNVFYSFRLSAVTFLCFIPPPPRISSSVGHSKSTHSSDSVHFVRLSGTSIVQGADLFPRCPVNDTRNVCSPIMAERHSQTDSFYDFFHAQYHIVTWRIIKLLVKIYEKKMYIADKYPCKSRPSYVWALMSCILRCGHNSAMLLFQAFCLTLFWSNKISRPFHGVPRFVTRD
jgi:hypothetical protein